MRRALLPLTVAVAATALTACGPVNRGVESVHQPVVSRANYTLDLSETGGELAAGEAVRLASWFDALRVGYGDRVSVDDPSPSRMTREEIAAVTARFGLLLGDSAPTSGATIEPGKVRVVLTRSWASVQGCPDWSRPSSPEFDGSMMSNYGCAANSNLAAMVADPMDLVVGRDAEVSDANTAARAIKSYREAAPSGSGGSAVAAASSKGGN